MPLYKTIHPNPVTQILIWKISESVSELLSQVVLKSKSQLRFESMKSEIHQRAFLSVRMLLKELNYTDFDLHYDDSGKPYFIDGKFVSITHSHQFSALIVSEQSVGIDIEKQRDKIIRISDKFVSSTELNQLSSSNKQSFIKKLTVNWGAKESIFKIRNEKGISFKDHISVKEFELNDQKSIASLKIENLEKHFSIHFEEFEGFSLVYAFEQ